MSHERARYDDMWRPGWPQLGRFLAAGSNGEVYLDKADRSKVVKVGHTWGTSWIDWYMKTMARFVKKESPFVMRIHAFDAQPDPNYSSSIYWYQGERMWSVRGFNRGLAFLKEAEKAHVYHEDCIIYTSGKRHHNIMQDAEGQLKFVDVDGGVRLRKTSTCVTSADYDNWL